MASSKRTVYRRTLEKLVIESTVSNKNIHLPVFEICVFRELALLILIERVGSR